jgi:hypothetical protein
MKSPKAIAITLILLAIYGIWMSTRSHSLPPPAPEKPAKHESAPPAAPPQPPASLPEPAPADDPVSAAPRPRNDASQAAGRRDYNNPLVAAIPASTPGPRQAADEDPEIAASFDEISRMLRAYHDLTGGNPVGTNREIMQAVMGGNPKGAQLGPPDADGLNADGELVDRWGTPYFFHQLGKDLMEIHSAGPDRRMGNDDDLVGR